MAKPPKFSPELQAEFIGNVLQSWAIDTELRLRKEARDKGKHIPQETLERLSWKIVTSDKLVHSFLLNFQDPSRIVEMKILDYTTRPNVDEIIDWAKRQGIRAFRKGIPGYKTRRDAKRLSAEQKTERIASAIIVSIGRGTNRRRRRGRWYNKTIYDRIGDLIGRVINEGAEFLLEKSKEALEDLNK